MRETRFLSALAAMAALTAAFVLTSPPVAQADTRTYSGVSTYIKSVRVVHGSSSVQVRVLFNEGKSYFRDGISVNIDTVSGMSSYYGPQDFTFGWETISQRTSLERRRRVADEADQPVPCSGLRTVHHKSPRGHTIIVPRSCLATGGVKPPRVRMFMYLDGVTMIDGRERVVSKRFPSTGLTPWIASN